MADTHKLEEFGDGRGEGARLDEGTRALRRSAARGRLGVLATLVAVVALATPVAASARDSSRDGSGSTSGSTQTTESSKQSGPGKQGPSGGGGSETKAAWSS